jgi:molybdopterin converting factor small subunit
VAELHLPGTLPPLFPGLSRHVSVDAVTVSDALDRLDAEHPGLRDRLVEPGAGLRAHIHVYVEGERAGLETPIADATRVDVITAISGG